MGVLLRKEGLSTLRLLWWNHRPSGQRKAWRSVVRHPELEDRLQVFHRFAGMLVDDGNHTAGRAADLVHLQNGFGLLQFSLGYFDRCSLAYRLEVVAVPGEFSRAHVFRTFQAATLADGQLLNRAVALRRFIACLLGDGQLSLAGGDLLPSYFDLIN